MALLTSLLGGSKQVKWIKRYKLALVGGLFVLLAVLVSHGKESPAPTYNFEKPPLPPAAVSVTAVGDPVRQPARETWQSPEKAKAKDEDVAGRQDAEGEEAPADSTDEDDLAGEFDEDEVRGEALAEVKDYNRQLASELRTVNPNARKARIRAEELRQKAQDLDEWITSQDSKTNSTPEEQMEWRAQRQVWVSHAIELKMVAQRLSATRGTKRKVRILAKEISDSLVD
jgi:hypothetical protein